MTWTQIRDSQRTIASKTALPILTLIGALGLAPNAVAQTITPGAITTAESDAAVRYRSLANTGGSEIYLGVPDLGVGSQRSEVNIVWAGTNDVTFVFDRLADKLTTTVVNSNDTYTLEYLDLSVQMVNFSKIFTVDDFDYMRLGIFNRDLGTTIDFNDVELDGNPLGDFTSAFVDHWMIHDYDFSQGFTVTGTLILTGAFSGSQELSRVELTVGKSNVCGNGVIELSEDCDDGNLDNGDCCSSTCEDEAGACDDGDACTENDTCGIGGCQGTPVDCSSQDGDCALGVCNPGSGLCEAAPANEGQPCDDGQACTFADVCIAGVCGGGPTCGNGMIDGICGEECDPPDGVTCDPTCRSVECGNMSVQIGEECDDGNTEDGDGCSSACQFEDKFCLIGESPAVARVAKRVAFVSDHDYLGTNADGNDEIFFFDKRSLDKAIKKAVKQGADAGTAASAAIAMNPQKYFEQLTDSLAPTVNELPSINGNGRVVAYVSNGDPLGSNADGNPELFRLDRKKFAQGDPNAFLQITDSSVGASLNPNLRAARGNLLMFDSDANLAPDMCVGGDDLLGTACATNTDCTGGVCGNPELNRELFVFVHTAFRKGGIALRQITATDAGESVVGQSVNFNTRATAFSSTANLLGTNPEGNREVFQITTMLDSTVPITSTASGTSDSPSQSKKKRVAFVSDANITGSNPDGNREILLWSLSDTPNESQPFLTSGCSSDAPSIDTRGRFLAFHSTCDLIPSSGNPDQSIFIWDSKVGSLLPLVVRGPMSTSSARPQASKKVRVLTFEGNLGAPDPAVCFLNAKQELFEILAP